MCKKGASSIELMLPVEHSMEKRVGEKKKSETSSKAEIFLKRILGVIASCHFMIRSNSDSKSYNSMIKTIIEEPCCMPISKYTLTLLIKKPSLHHLH